MPKDKNHVHDTAFTLSETVRETHQAIANTTVSIQERNAKYMQGIFDHSIEVLKSHIESSRALMQNFAEQAQRQQEAFQVLARESMDTSMNFFLTPYSYYQQALETAESIAMQGVETAQRITHQGVETAQRVTEQESHTARTATK